MSLEIETVPDALGQVEIPIVAGSIGGGCLEYVKDRPGFSGVIEPLAFQGPVGRWIAAVKSQDVACAIHAEAGVAAQGNDGMPAQVELLVILLEMRLERHACSGRDESNDAA